MKLEHLYTTTFVDEEFFDGSINYVDTLAASLPCSRSVYTVIKLTAPLTGKSVILSQRDKGPYFIDDDDFVLRGERPRIEKYWHVDPDKRKPLPRGRNVSKSFRGKCPASPASVDVTPEVWVALGFTEPGYGWELFSYDNMTMEWPVGYNEL